METHGWAIKWVKPEPHISRHTQNGGEGKVEKSDFQIAAERLEINENVNRSHLRTHWLAVGCEVIPQTFI